MNYRVDSILRLLAKPRSITFGILGILVLITACNASCISRQCVTNASNPISIRKGPGPTNDEIGEVIGSIPQNAEVTVICGEQRTAKIPGIEQRIEWVKIKLDNNEGYGWVAKDKIKNCPQ